MNPTIEIAGLADLKPPLPVQANLSVAKPVHRTEVLARLLVDNKESAEQQYEGAYILDVLGQYDPQNNSITIFKPLVEEAASRIGVTEDVLLRVVALHEYAHYVTHLGKDSSGDIWNDYIYASIADKEMFAQVYTYFSLVERNDTVGLQAFLKLNERQPSVYTLWERHKNTPIAQVNDELIKARLRGSFAFQIAITESGRGLMMSTRGGVWLDHTGAIYNASTHEFDPEPQKGRRIGVDLGRDEMERFQECIERITNVKHLANPSGPGMLMDGSSKTFYIKCPSGEALFIAPNGNWGKTAPEFDWLLNRLGKLNK